MRQYAMQDQHARRQCCPLADDVAKPGRLNTAGDCNKQIVNRDCSASHAIDYMRPTVVCLKEECPVSRAAFSVTAILVKRPDEAGELVPQHAESTILATENILNALHRGIVR